MLHVFIHTPRTGGTTVTRLLSQRFRVHHLNPPAMATFVRDPSSIAGADVLAGHMPFGIDRFVGPVEYSTFLRDPVDRFISTWRFVRSAPAHPNHALGLSLLDYLRCTDTYMNDNGMVRRMAAYDWSEILTGEPYWWQRIPHGRVTRYMLDQAKENLRRCAFVGIFDRYERDARAMLARYGIDAPIPRDNASPGQFTPTDAEVAAIGARHELDSELYEFAKTLTP